MRSALPPFPLDKQTDHVQACCVSLLWHWPMAGFISHIAGKLTFARSMRLYWHWSMAGPTRPSLSATLQAAVIWAALHSLVPQ